jgi:hypothetical protein
VTRYGSKVDYCIEVGTEEGSLPSHKTLLSLQGYKSLHAAQVAALTVIIKCVAADVDIYRRTGGFHGVVELHQSVKTASDAVSLLRAILDKPQ